MTNMKKRIHRLPVLPVIFALLVLAVLPLAGCGTKAEKDSGASAELQLITDESTKAETKTSDTTQQAGQNSGSGGNSGTGQADAAPANSTENPDAADPDAMPQQAELHDIAWDADLDGDPEELLAEFQDNGDEAVSGMLLMLFGSENSYAEGWIEGAYELQQINVREEDGISYLEIQYLSGDYYSHDTESVCYVIKNGDELTVMDAPPAAQDKDSAGATGNTASSDGTAKDTEASAGADITVTEDGTYSSRDEVALYLHLYGHLPSNYITKQDAEAIGWDASRKNLWKVAPGKSIGGSRFGNYEGLLPDEKGRKYYECDIDYNGGGRNAKRIVYSNDGLIFYTDDHYETFEQLY